MKLKKKLRRSQSERNTYYSEDWREKEFNFNKYSRQMINLTASNFRSILQFYFPNGNSNTSLTKLSKRLSQLAYTNLSESFVKSTRLMSNVILQNQEKIEYLHECYKQAKEVSSVMRNKLEIFKLGANKQNLEYEKEIEKLKLEIKMKDASDDPAEKYLIMIEQLTKKCEVLEKSIDVIQDSARKKFDKSNADLAKNDEIADGVTHLASISNKDPNTKTTSTSNNQSKSSFVFPSTLPNSHERRGIGVYRVTGGKTDEDFKPYSGNHSLNQTEKAPKKIIVELDTNKNTARSSFAPIDFRKRAHGGTSYREKKELKSSLREANMNINWLKKYLNSKNRDLLVDIKQRDELGSYPISRKLRNALRKRVKKDIDAKKNYSLRNSSTKNRRPRDLNRRMSEEFKGKGNFVNKRSNSYVEDLEAYDRYADRKRKRMPKDEFGYMMEYNTPRRNARPANLDDRDTKVSLNRYGLPVKIGI